MAFSITKNYWNRIVRGVELGGILEETNPGDTHLVRGQSSRLVGTDHIRTTKSLDAWKIPDDCILLGHLFGSKGKACCNHGGEALGYGGNSKCYSNLEVVDSTVDYTAVGRIPEVLEINDPDENTNDRNNFGECVAKVIQLAFKGCLLIYLGCDGLVNITNGRLLTGKDYDGLSATIHDSGPLGELR